MYVFVLFCISRELHTYNHVSIHEEISRRPTLTKTALTGLDTCSVQTIRIQLFPITTHCSYCTATAF